MAGPYDEKSVDENVRKRVEGCERERGESIINRAQRIKNRKPENEISSKNK